MLLTIIRVISFLLTLRLGQTNLPDIEYFLGHGIIYIKMCDSS